MEDNPYKPPRSSIQKDRIEEPKKKFSLYGTGVGLGLLAAIIALFPSYIIGGLVLARFSKLFPTITTIVVPSLVFFFIVSKICRSTPNIKQDQSYRESVKSTLDKEQGSK